MQNEDWAEIKFDEKEAIAIQTCILAYMEQWSYRTDLVEIYNRIVKFRKSLPL